MHHVLLREIALCAGVHISTVSLALRDSKRLSLLTRQRIRDVAHQLGYVANALAGSLSRYRSQSQQIRERPKIAWVTSHPTPDGWKTFQSALQAFVGAERVAGTLGYQMECVWLGGAETSAGRAAEILRNSQAIGLLIAPAPAATARLKLPWQDYASVGIGLTLTSPSLHVVANHHYRSAKLAMTELTRRGYRRIGLVLLARANNRVEQGWLGGYLAFSEESGPESVPPLILERWETTTVRRWYARHRPEVIVTRHLELQTILAKLGVLVPRDVGLALLSVPDNSGRVAGIDENAEAVGAGACSLLADMITRGEKGIPERPQRLLFEGHWVDGATLTTPEFVSASRSERPADAISNV